MSDFKFRALDTLANGATVVAATKVGDNDHVVLAIFREGEYVTWRVNDEGVAAWGDYFEDFGNAAEGYKDRVDGRKG